MDRLNSVDMADARWRLRAAWRRLYPDQGDESMPELLTATESGPEPTRRPSLLASLRALINGYSEPEPDDDPDPATPAGGAALPAPIQRVNANAVDLSTFASRTGRGRLFIDLRRFAEAPDWVAVIPPPATFEHEWYGTIVITAERNARFVANFEQRVYGQDLPVDAEHETKLSGAFGWIRELRLTDDGAVEARIEWTERGLLAFEKEAFRYVSPEWFDWWEQPMTGVAYQDVLCGLALCNRPFFKESSLPPLFPLVASETGQLSAAEGVPSWMAARRAGSSPLAPNVNEVDSTKGDPMSENAENQVAAQTVTLTEEQYRQFAEQRDQLTQLTEQVTRLNAAKTALEAANAAAAREAMVRRFTDEVRGRSEANPNQWAGEIAVNVDTLVALAEAHGEESERFTKHVANQRGVAKLAADSQLFSAVGSTEGASIAATAYGELDAKARAYAEANKVSFPEGMERVAEQNPALYRQYIAEQRAR